MASSPAASREMHLLLWPQYKPRNKNSQRQMSPKKLFRSGERKQIEERKDLGACAHEEPIKSPHSRSATITRTVKEKEKKGPVMDEDSDDGDLHRPLSVPFWRKFTWRRGISVGSYTTGRYYMYV